MNKFIFLLAGLLLSTNALAQSTLNTTDLFIDAGPTAKQLKVAQAILGEAIEALESGDDETYLLKLDRAKEYMAFRKAKVSFKAAFVVTDDSKETNYFADFSSSLRYDYSVEMSCFNGQPKEALSLLKAVIITGHLNYDEEWFANARLQGRDILIDFVDGPNDYTETRKISPCK